MFGRVLDRLAEVHRTRHEVLVFTASGTGSMEGAVANTCSPGDRVLVVSFGNFGERWVAIAEAYGCEVVHLRYDWGETPQASDIASALAESGATAVFTTQSETSTGVVADIEAISGAVGGARCSWSMPSRASAPSRSRPTRGEWTSSSPARRRRL